MQSKKLPAAGLKNFLLGRFKDGEFRQPKRRGRFKSDGSNVTLHPICVHRDVFIAKTNSPNLSATKKTGNAELLAF